jgi:hypothetical protein
MASVFRTGIVWRVLKTGGIELKDFLYSDISPHSCDRFVADRASQHPFEDFRNVLLRSKLAGEAE